MLKSWARKDQNCTKYLLIANFKLHYFLSKSWILNAFWQPGNRFRNISEAVMGSSLGRWGNLFYWDLLKVTLHNYGIHHSPLKILKSYRNKYLEGLRSLDFSGKGYKMFWPGGHTFHRRWIFLYSESDNIYSISMTVFGYNPKLLP